MRTRTNVGHSLRFPQTGLAKLVSLYCLSLMVEASLVNSSLAPKLANQYCLAGMGATMSSSSLKIVFKLYHPKR